MVFVVWIVGGLLSLFGALTYAELAAAMPEAGGEYVYLREAYGPFWGFLYGWTQMWVAKSGSIATLATGFFYYLANFRPGLESVAFAIPLPLGPDGGPLEIRYGQLLAMAVILVSGRVELLRRESRRRRPGRRHRGQGRPDRGHRRDRPVGRGTAAAANFSTSIPAAGGVAGFFAALVAALWAYDGWNNVSMVSSRNHATRSGICHGL